MQLTIVTVSAKTSLVRNLNHIFDPAYATLNSYPHSMSPVARFKWFAFLGVDLQPCKTITDTLAPVEHYQLGVISLEFHP